MITENTDDIVKKLTWYYCESFSSWLMITDNTDDIVTSEGCPRSSAEQSFVHDICKTPSCPRRATGGTESHDRVGERESNLDTPAKGFRVTIKMSLQ